MKQRNNLAKSFLALALCGIGSLGAWAQQSVSYIERSWNGTQVVSTTKTVSATFIEGDWDSKGSETMTLERGKWYYIPSKAYNGNKPVERKRLIIPYQAHGENGDIHIILGDGAELRSVITFQGYKYTSSSFENGTLHIYAQSDGENMGKIIANASNGGEAIRNLTDCAGIGGTDESDDDFTSGNRKSNSCGTLYIHGGDIYAKGNTLAAGIGGGDDGNGGNIYIYGGKVRAYGGDDAAGIGGGEDGNGGKLYVYGGEVFADGTDWAAGIGGGEDGDGAEVHLLGGSVTAWAGNSAGNDGGLAFGGGDSGESRGSLEIGNNMMVHAGQSSGASNYKLFSVNERVAACFYRPYAKIEPCTHGGNPSYVINGEGTSGTHSLKCSYCKGYDNQAHTFDTNNKCTVCGAGNTTYTINMWVPKITEGGVVGYLEEPLTATVAQGNTFTVPTPDDRYLPTNMTFVGWVRTGIAVGESYIYNNETLVHAGDVLTMDGNNLTFKAKYKENNIILGTDDDAMILEQNAGKQVPMVTIQGLTMYKDGSWNTICLPFDYNFTSTGNPWNNDNPDVRMLKASSWDKDNQVLTLNFTEKNTDLEGNAITTLEAGRPYLIRWDNTNGQNLSDGLAFYNVTIDNTKRNKYTDYAAFSGTFTPYSRIYTTSEYKTDLYLGGNNTLYYPTAEGFKVGAYHAYFTLSNGLYANETGIHNLLDQDTTSGARIILNFGDETEGIDDTVANSALNTSTLTEWYTLDGRQLSGKPTQKGIYVQNGKKVIIK